MLLQGISLAGAVLVLSAFALLQAGRLSSATAAYQLMNLFGGFFLLLAALDARQSGLILIEGAWTVVSAWGLWKVGRRNTENTEH